MAKARALGERRKGAGDPRADSRAKLVRAIRAACARKGIDDEDRRAIQRERIGKASLSDMSFAELGQMLDHLNRDWSGAGDRRHLAKCRALWWSLYWLGAIDDPSEDALSAFVRRQTGVGHLRFLDHRLAPSVIEALKSWLEREGVHWWATDQLEAVVAHRPGFTAALADRHAVLGELGRRLARAGVMRGGDIYDWVSASLKRNLANHWSMTAGELDIAIRELGKHLRKKGGEA